MREVFGKEVLESDEEVLAPGHTALVVVDMQNDFAHPQGYFSAHGIDVGSVFELGPRLAAFVEAARKSGPLVVWVQQTTLPDGRSDSPPWLAFKMRHGFDGQYTLEGSWGQTIIEPLRPVPEEPVVRKFRSSAFVGTSLDSVLRANGIRSVVVCGCMTEGCVESTVRDAAFNDYYAGVVEDLVASNTPAYHEASLLVMRSQFRVLRSERLLAVWSREAA